MKPILRLLILPLILCATFTATAQKPVGPLTPARLAPAAVAVPVHPSLTTQTGNRNGVMCFALSADGRFAASGGADPSVILWDMASGKQLRRFTGVNQSQLHLSVSLSRDGSTLLASSTNHIVRIWDTATGKEKRRFLHTATYPALLTPDGNFALTAHGQTKQPSEMRLWQVATGRLARRFVGHSDMIYAAALSPNGKMLLTGSADGTARLWDIATGKETRRLTGHDRGVSGVAWTPDAKFVVTGGEDKTARLWSVASGREVRRFEEHKADVHSVVVSSDGKTLFTGDRNGQGILWNLQTGEKQHLLEVKFGGYRSPSFWIQAQFTCDGRELLTSGYGALSIVVWDVTTGKEARRIEGTAPQPLRGRFSADGRSILIASADLSVCQWTPTAANLVTTGFSDLSRITVTGTSVAVTPDARVFALGGGNAQDVMECFQKYKYQFGKQKTIYNATDVWLFDNQTITALRCFEGHTRPILAVAISRDGKWVVSSSKDGTVRLWNAETGQEQQKIQVPLTDTIAISPDGSLIATARAIDAMHNTTEASIYLWDARTGKQVGRLQGHTLLVRALRFAPDGKSLLSGGADYTARQWDIATLREMRVLRGHTFWVTGCDYSPDGRFFLTLSWDGTTRLWDAATGSELCSLLHFGDDSWAVTDPEGRYDASQPDGIEGLYWVVGNHPIALSQLKERYYEPNLLAKIMARKPLRNVAAFKNLPLFPEVIKQNLAGTRLSCTLVNQGGGIGRAQVYVNDVLFTDNALPRDANSNAPSLQLTLDVASAPTFRKDGANTVRIVAYNAANWLPSRGVQVASAPVGGTSAPLAPRRLFAIVCGISDYAAPELRLGFAARDAEAFAQALRLGAKRFFTAGVEVTLLSSSSDAPDALLPTRANLERAFGHIRDKAGPEDVVVVYLAGHGVALAADNSLYCYLTQDANTADTAKLSADLTLRRRTALSSIELAGWMTGAKGVRANYRVLILDTCAAGAAEAGLMVKRDVPGDQIRAMERFKDRTGFHVLMGCAADRVSYEASRYGQGVLTYALLQGMKGAALREGEWVDVRTLFGYCEDAVPKLAGDIGGVQQPRYQKPGSGSFDIGQLKLEDRQAIRLPGALLQLLRPRLTNQANGDDDLELEKPLRRLLLDRFYAARRGGADQAAPTVGYVDAEDLTGAIRPVGQYTRAGGKVVVRLTLKRNKATVGALTVEGSESDPGGLAAKIADALVSAVGKVSAVP